MHDLRRSMNNQQMQIIGHRRKAMMGPIAPYWRACARLGAHFCQNLALMANCGDGCVLLFCGRESLACRVPYCQAGYIREWLQLLI